MTNILPFRRKLLATQLDANYAQEKYAFKVRLAVIIGIVSLCASLWGYGAFLLIQLVK